MYYNCNKVPVFFVFSCLQGALNLQDKVLEGDKKLNAHFGEAIAAVGDLNQDGFEGIIFHCVVPENIHTHSYSPLGTSKGEVELGGGL